MQIPTEMKEVNRWCIYVLGDGQGHKRKKFPYSPITKNKISTTRPKEWVSYETALKAYDNATRPQDCGLGFLLGDGWGCLDVDNIAPDGLDPQDIDNPAVYKALDLTGWGYSEISQSKTGIHCFFKLEDEPPKHHNKNKEAEIYTGGRFIAMTGNKIQPDQPSRTSFLDLDQFKLLLDAYGLKEISKAEQAMTDPDAMLNIPPNHPDYIVMMKALASKTGQRVAMLFFEGKHSDPKINQDHSAKDLSLCNDLALFTNGNTSQIDRLFRKSALYRPKWDEPRGALTYGQRTIQLAIKGIKEALY
ncbi:hypothetical protein O0Z71_07270 [Ligilactobacillus saerimneri]|uniref:phage NrS-1 polymerase family protein n=1 Tax=Ligilactobacillus saerimneri TaxID=228229 RepID=UPI0022A719EB|nr:hypothetical protein [Ligilactobacillus saerimneri]MCZ0892223.1 hypothetical protein [Ligilactobacillus saerimneri]